MENLGSGAGSCSGGRMPSGGVVGVGAAGVWACTDPKAIPQASASANGVFVYRLSAASAENKG
jgi:hypothetical protein